MNKKIIALTVFCVTFAAVLVAAGGIYFWSPEAKNMVPGHISTVNSQVSFTIEYDTDRMYGDYKDFDLSYANHEVCRDECAKDPNCRAYTFVRPGVQGANARCWLKNTVPNPQGSACCITGVKTGGDQCPCKNRCPDCEGLPSQLCLVEGESEKARACRQCMSNCQ